MPTLSTNSYTSPNAPTRIIRVRFTAACPSCDTDVEWHARYEFDRVAYNIDCETCD